MISEINLGQAHLLALFPYSPAEMLCRLRFHEDNSTDKSPKVLQTISHVEYLGDNP